jgi:hypothetical protein
MNMTRHETTTSKSKQMTRIMEMQQIIQQLEREKADADKLLNDMKQAEHAKDAQVQQLTAWCRQLSATNQTLLQDKAGMLHQAKQTTEWCQQLIQANQRLQQEKAQLAEQYNRHLGATADSDAQQRDIDELMRQKTILIQFASEQAKQMEQVVQANAQLLAMNQDLERKLHAKESIS